MLLLEECWRDLFLLSLGQWDVPIDLSRVLGAAGLTNQDVGGDKMASLMADVTYMRDLALRFRHLCVDRTEYACLKAIVTFRPGEFT